MKFVNCRNELVPTTTSHKFNSIPPIEIHYLEAYKCQQCNEIFLTRSALYKIEAIESKLKETTEISWEPVPV